MEEGFFKGAENEKIQLSAGGWYDLPIRYLDWSAIHALFPASSAQLRQLLPSKKLIPMSLCPGKALISLMAMEYRQIAGVKPYNEFSIGIPVQYEPTVNIPGMILIFHPLLAPQRYEKFGVYIYRLPVTTEEANALGIEIWGYPKIVTEIVFEETGIVRRCRLRTGGADTLILEVKKLPTKIRSIDLYSYSVKDKQLLRTKIQTQGQYGISRSLGGGRCKLGDGPIADDLRGLKIGKTALGCFYAEHVQSILPRADERLSM